MWSLVKSYVSVSLPWLTIAKYAAIVGTVGAILLGIRVSGKRAAQAQMAAQVAKIRRKQLEKAIEHRDYSTVRGRMFDGTF